MNIFEYVFYFETDKGTIGIVRADDAVDAQDRIKNKYPTEQMKCLACCAGIEDSDYGIVTIFGKANKTENKEI